MYVLSDEHGCSVGYILWKRNVVLVCQALLCKTLYFMLLDPITLLKEQCVILTCAYCALRFNLGVLPG